MYKALVCVAFAGLFATGCGSEFEGEQEGDVAAIESVETAEHGLGQACPARRDGFPAPGEYRVDASGHELLLHFDCRPPTASVTHDYAFDVAAAQRDKISNVRVHSDGTISFARVPRWPARWVQWYRFTYSTDGGFQINGRFTHQERRHARDLPRAPQVFNDMTYPYYVVGF